MSKLKDKIASALGSVLEWYDFALYGFFAPLIAELYFPSDAPQIGLLKAFSVFAIGFLARPIGALIFGSLSDRYGRSFSLQLTPLLITLPTLCFALLPTYQQIGVAAPVLLIILRVLQGICIGGEFANNIVYLCESTAPKNHFFLGSIGSLANSFGIFLASAAASLCYFLFTKPVLLSGAWRIPFAISLLLGLICYFIRKNMDETPVFKQVLKTEDPAKGRILSLLNSQKRECLVGFLISFLPATAFYFVFFFLPNYMDTTLKIDSAKMLGDNSISLLLRFIAIPLLGLLADRIGGLFLARISCVGFLFLSGPFFFGIINHSSLTYLFILALALMTTLNAATTPGLLVKLFKPESRCTSVAITSNIAFGVFGGIVPIISLLLITRFANPMASVYYLMISAFITFVATIFYKEAIQHVRK